MKKMVALWLTVVLTLAVSGPTAVFADDAVETQQISLEEAVETQQVAASGEIADVAGEEAVTKLAETAESVSKISEGEAVVESAHVLPETESVSTLPGIEDDAKAETEPSEKIQTVPSDGIQTETDAEEEQPAEELEEAEEAAAEEILEQGAEPSVSYRTHVQRIGWQDPVSDGAMSGTQGQSKRLEAIEITVQGADDLGVRYMTHVQTYGWETAWRENGEMSGTSGQAKRLEAIRIELTGTDAQYFDIWYCVHAQHFGWLDWAKNGEEAGTAGYAYRLEGIKIKIMPKGGSAPAREGSQRSAFFSKSEGPSVNTDLSGIVYNTHVQTYGWQEYVGNGSMSGTSGESKRLEGIHIRLANQYYSGGVEYRTHVQSIGWQDWKRNGEMSGTSGQAKRLEGIEIRLTGEIGNIFDIYYQVHAQTYGWLDWAVNGQMAGTSGLAKRLEGIKIVLIPKGLAAPGPTNRPNVTPATAPAAAPAQTPVVAPSAPAAQTPAATPAAYTLIGNRNSRIFHKSTCESVAKMKEKNKVALSSREEAISLGYTPCHNCNP